MPQLDYFLKDHERYDQVSYVSRGSFGSVLLARDKELDREVALKFLARGAKITKYTQREILNQLRLRHPHIIELDEVFLTDRHLVLVMEYATGGNMLAYLTAKGGKLAESEARWFFQQVLMATDYCHQLGIANRDIKLENLLLHGGTATHPLVKQADFGFSKDENHQSAPGSRVGTPAYLAPEVITNPRGQTYDGKKADVWSLGVLLFVMLAGCYPFSCKEDQGTPSEMLHLMLQRILLGGVRYPSSLGLSQPCLDLISKMLVADPKQRPTVQEVLHHPWVCQGLDPNVFRFNDPLVERTKAHPPSDQVLEEVKSIVEEARELPGERRRVQAEQVMEQRQLGGMCSTFGTEDFDDFYDDDDIIWRTP